MTLVVMTNFSIPIVYCSGRIGFWPQPDLESSHVSCEHHLFHHNKCVRRQSEWVFTKKKFFCSDKHTVVNISLISTGLMCHQNTTSTMATFKLDESYKECAHVCICVTVFLCVVRSESMPGLPHLISRLGTLCDCLIVVLLGRPAEVEGGSLHSWPFHEKGCNHGSKPRGGLNYAWLNKAQGYQRAMFQQTTHVTPASRRAAWMSTFLIKRLKIKNLKIVNHSFNHYFKSTYIQMGVAFPFKNKFCPTIP